MTRGLRSVQESAPGSAQCRFSPWGSSTVGACLTTAIQKCNRAGGQTDPYISGLCRQCPQTPKFQDHVNTVNTALNFEIAQRALFNRSVASLFRQFRQHVGSDFPDTSMNVVSRVFQEHNILGVQKKCICYWKWFGIYRVGTGFDQSQREHLRINSARQIVSGDETLAILANSA